MLAYACRLIFIEQKMTLRNFCRCGLRSDWSKGHTTRRAGAPRERGLYFHRARRLRQLLVSVVRAPTGGTPRELVVHGAQRVRGVEATRTFPFPFEQRSAFPNQPALLALAIRRIATI